MVQHAVWAGGHPCRIRLAMYIVSQASMCCRYWFSTYQTENSVGLIATADNDANNILNAIFSTGAAVALIVTLFLDNTIPGTKYAGPRGPCPPSPPLAPHGRRIPAQLYVPALHLTYECCPSASGAALSRF